MRLLLGLLLVTTATLALRSCTDICADACADTTAAGCERACKKTCNGIPNSGSKEDIWFEARVAFELPTGEQITSGDAPQFPLNYDYYLTTRCGKLYHYVTSTSVLTELYHVDSEVLNLDNGKGLYSVAMDRDYARNNKLYIAYAARLKPRDAKVYYIPGVVDPNLLSSLTVNHHTVIQQITLNGRKAVVGPVLKEIEQFSPDNEGNWMGTLHSDPLTHGVENRILFATGGNPDEDILLATYGPHLSSLHLMVPNKARTEELWASAIKVPVECSATSQRASVVHCLIETEDVIGQKNGTVLYALKRGTNYGSPDFIQQCAHRSMACKQRINDHFNREGLFNFPSSQCPVRTLHIFTGSNLPNFEGKILAVRDSCYNAKADRFTEVELLYIAYNAGYGTYSATPLKTYFEHRYLTGVKLLGADWQNTLLISGVSMTSGNTVVQELIPEKAKDFITLE